MKRQQALDFLIRVYQDVRWRAANLPLALVWRPTERALLRRYVRNPAPVVLDVGANLGASVAFYRRVFPGGTIIAFEPDPRTYALLARRHGGRPRIILHNKGVGASAGRLVLHRTNMSPMNSFLELDESAPWPKQFRELRMIAPVEVDVVTLDDVARESRIDCIDFVKCDTQGFEPEVLRGAQRLLQEQRIGLLKLEVLPGRFYRRTVSLYEVESILHPFGYELCAISGMETDQSGEIRNFDAYFVSGATRAGVARA